MILLVDVGNTSTKISTASESILSVSNLATHRDHTPDELYVHLKALGIKDVDDGVVCSVVPEVTAKYVSMLRKRFNVSSPLVVTPYIETGLELNYKNLSNLGADRIANAVGAHSEYGKDAAVVDFGTATTIDFITAKGVYLGGVIAPGLKESLTHLVSSTSKLFEVETVKPERVIGRSTEECIQSGFFLLTVGLVEAARVAARRETGIDFTFIATGGLAESFAPFANSIEIIDRDLTLKGCLELYRLNKGGKGSAGL